MEIDVSKCPMYEDGYCNDGLICTGESCVYVLEQQLQQLKQENEELKEQLEQADEDIKFECTRCALTNKLEQCLDEIEEICQNETINLTDSCVNGGRYFEILQLIKQAKGGK